MTLRKHIDDIRTRLEMNQFTSEAAVSHGIVRRLLQVLAWPIYDIQVVIPEYSVEVRNVDFALCHPPLKPLVFIEVKKVGNIGGAERQLFEYAFHKGVPIAILTDGQEWHFFHPSGQGDYGERKVYELNLIERDSEDSATRLNRYLNYESIRTGEAIRLIEEDYRNASRQRLIETSLPEAWSTLVKEADEFLIEVVVDKTESLCGYKPTNEQVLDFLKSLKREKSLEEIHSPMPPSLIPPDPPRPTKIPRGFDQIQAVIQLMRKGEIYAKAVDSVAKARTVGPSTVRAHCTRTLDLNTQEFVEYVESGRIIQELKNKYPKQVELINELERS